MDGFLCVNKPAGMSSSDVVMNVRRLTGEKKAGHCGTLDPNACGLVVVAFGRALRLIEYTESFPKLYRARAVLGLATDTHDVWGTPVRDIRRGLVFPSREEIEDALASLHGQIEQVPSKYSALKLDGRRLYELAREGADVSARPRQIGIFETALRGYDREKGELFFDVRCSSGTYVRTLCDTIGETLGCGAAMSFLLRLEACGMSVGEAVALEELAAMDEEKTRAHLIPCERAVSGLPRCEISDERAGRFLDGLDFAYGQVAFEDGLPIPGCPVTVWNGGRFLGTALPYMNEGRLSFKAVKVMKPV